MEIIAKWNYNPEYFEQYWNDWMEYRSKGRKHIVLLGLALVIVGIFIYLGIFPHIPSNHSRGIIIVLIGIALASWHFWDKKKWLKAMLKDSNPDNEMVMTFNQKGIKTKSDISSGEASWKLVKELVPAQKGLFLILQKGISIYLPKQAVTQGDDISQIIELFSNRTA